MPSLKFLNLDSQVHKVWLFYIGPSPNSMSFTSGFIFFFDSFIQINTPNISIGKESVDHNSPHMNQILKFLFIP